jgi:hypothetical protein
LTGGVSMKSVAGHEKGVLGEDARQLVGAVEK